MRREIFVQLSDFHVDRSTVARDIPDIEFDLYFDIEKPEETGTFNDLHNVYRDGTEDLQLHFRFVYDELNKIRKIKYRAWGGPHEGQTVSPEVLQEIYHVFLGALRDAESSLRPIKGNKLGQLYMNIQTKSDSKDDLDHKEALAEKLRVAMHHDLEWNELVNLGTVKINEHLQNTTISGKTQDVDIAFLPFEFQKIVDGLKIQMPIYAASLIAGDPSKQRYFELYQNGLGYNNLIYIATVLGDLKQKKEQDSITYAALLIEEPEAHLHPQLQNVFFDYLDSLDKELGFQIFITSHSPTITAKAQLDSVLVIQNQENRIQSLSLKNSGLTPENRTYLHKFLDVTKSQFLFSNGVIFVEGISKALLLPVFAKMMGPEFDLTKNGIEIVNINGVAFEHFANLFNDSDPAKNLSLRSAIVTDDDRDQKTEEISPRAMKALVFESSGQKVFLNPQTFEYALFMEGNNDTALLSVFKELRPKAHGNLAIGKNKSENAIAFVDKVKSNKAKSELAHQLSILLSMSQAERIIAKIPEPIQKALEEEFKIPEPIQQAIKYVTKQD